MTRDGYGSLPVKGDKVLVRESSIDALKAVDAVVFDCDGVLVDTRGSYDATVAKVTDRMVRELTAVRLPYGSLLSESILRLRRTGAFNNDWDTTYALTLFSILSLDQTVTRKERTSSSKQVQSTNEARATLTRLRNFLDEFCSSPREIGYAGVNNFLAQRRLSAASRFAIKKARDYLGYPGSPPSSLMTTLFDETYCGPKLFKKIYGFQARYHLEEGMIERERLLITREILEKLKVLLRGKKIAMATGRPFEATKYSLNHLMVYFDRKASTYIGDADIYPELALEYEKYRKPRGESLNRAKKQFDADRVLYVGDSTEDQMMVENANRDNAGILFAAVSGTALSEEEQASYFKKRGADMVLKSVRQVPLALEAFRN